MTPKKRKEELEDAIDNLIQEYEKETGLEVFSTHFWRDHKKIPTLSFTIKVPK